MTEEKEQNFEKVDQPTTIDDQEENKLIPSTTNDEQDQTIEKTSTKQNKTEEQIEIDRLSSIVESQKLEINELNTRLVFCQNHYETIINKQREDYAREKQSTVMRYAQAEKSKLDSDKRSEMLTTKTNDLIKEKENLQTKLSEMKTMNNKLQQAFESKINELTNLRKDFDKVKELNQSIDVTLKSTLNHLKGETTQLKEQKELNERLKRDFLEQKEINDQLTIQCQKLNETLKSIPSDDERSQTLNQILDEHNALKNKYFHLQEENQRIRENLKSKDEDRIALENVIENFRQNAFKEKENTKKLYDDLLAAREQDSIEISRLKQIETLYGQTLADNSDLRQLLDKEHQFIQLTQTLTEKNSILQSDFEQIQIFLKEKSNENEKLIQINEEQKQKLIRLENIENCLNEKIREVQQNFEDLNRSHDEILKKYQDSQVEIAALKKKHQANTKDLIKQLQLVQKSKTINQEDGICSNNVLSSQTKSFSSKENPTENNSSRCSRTSSIGSMNEATSNSSPDQPILSTIQQNPVKSSIVQEEEEQEVLVNIIDVDRQKLIDKLIKQQKLLVRRNEKIEFLNDHIQLLTQDLQTKRRIIQSYAMNADGFMYTSNKSDSIKQQLAEKSRTNSTSLMATLYNRATTNTNQTTNRTFHNLFPDPSQTMTLETALDIMGKLQSVLEDTLLKNLTLKENVDTLSQEIDRLSRKVNR